MHISLLFVKPPAIRGLNFIVRESFFFKDFWRDVGRVNNAPHSQLHFSVALNMPLCSAVRGHVRGVPGDADAAGPRAAVLGGLPAGGAVRAGQQRGRDPRRRLQAVPRRAAALRPARQEHRQLAGQQANTRLYATGTPVAATNKMYTELLTWCPLVE